MRHLMTIMLLLPIALVHSNRCAANDSGWVSTPSGAEIHYRRAGAGNPLVLVPGWSFSGDIFAKQIEYFSKSYEVIAIDPRGQGKSSKEAQGNSYAEHGADIKAVLDELAIRQVNFVGWSWGCYDVFSYMRRFGASEINSFVCIDEPAIGWSTDPADWAGLQSLEALASLYHGVSGDRQAFTEWFVPWMVTRPLTESELKQLVDMSFQTPDHVATALAVDGMLSDYSAEARLLDGLMPTFFIIREEFTDVAGPWMAEHMPNTRLLFKGGHMMFWEFPQEINDAIADFLRSAQIRPE